MGSGEEKWSSVPPPSPTLMVDLERQEQWRHFDNSVNAVSFGFVATAILVSMFLLMAIFERFFRPTSFSSSSSSSSSTSTTSSDLESSPVIFHSKFHHPSPKMTVYTNGVSVLMPGEDIPTFLAYPTPQPCPPEPIMKPFDPHNNTCLTFNLA